MQQVPSYTAPPIQYAAAPPVQQYAPQVQTSYAAPAQVTYAAAPQYAQPQYAPTYAAAPQYAAPATYAAAPQYAPTYAAAPVQPEVSIDWGVVNSRLPYEQTPDQKAQRNKMFRDIDLNGNGFLSLAEVDKGVRDVIQLDQVFDCKQVIMRAFQAAKNYGGDTSGFGPDYIEKKEFRILLQYIRSYFEVFEMFQILDVNSDRKVSHEEFIMAATSLADWGLNVDPAALPGVFQQIDINGGGEILFVEFADWAIAQKLDLNEEENRPLQGPEQPQYAVANQEYLQAPVTYAAAPPVQYAAPPQVTYAAAPQVTYAAAPQYAAAPTYAAPPTYAAAPQYAAQPQYAQPQYAQATYAAAPATYAAPPIYNGGGGVPQY